MSLITPVINWARARSIWAPFTFTAYLTPIVTFVMVYIYYLRKDRLADYDDPPQIYGAKPSVDELPEMHEFA